MHPSANLARKSWPARTARPGPMAFLATGDVVEVDIDGIGLLGNPVGASVAARARPHTRGVPS
jgi:2-keto-4-pentenoate hydratase/2-oxohepta-3-ene-1,7-dioic acid hydratase in catechol pathway